MKSRNTNETLKDVARGDKDSRRKMGENSGGVCTEERVVR